MLARPAAPTPISRHGHVSASQIKTARLCWRKWWFEKVANVREPPKRHFAVGSALHGVGERYLAREYGLGGWGGLFPDGWNKGIDPEDDTMIRKMAELAIERGVWQAKDGLAIEYPLAYLVGRRFVDSRGMPLVARAVTMTNDQGVRQHVAFTSLYDGSPLPLGWDDLSPFVGFSDVIDIWARPHPLIIDHKTAKSRVYALTSEKLVEDVQMLSYAALPLATYPEFDMVGLRHNIFLKDVVNPDVYTVSGVVTVERVARCWDEIIETTTEMNRLRVAVPKLPGPPEHRADNFVKVTGALEQGRMRESCDAFGGCMFKDVCKGRQTICSLVQRSDAPPPPPRRVIKRQTFRLNPSPSTN